MKMYCIHPECLRDVKHLKLVLLGAQTVNSPSFSRGWLGTEEHVGCSGPRGPPIGRRDSSLHPCPHNFGGLWWTEIIYRYD